jgi:hypothetical protein
MKIRRVTKRDGREVPFDPAKIAAAVARAEIAVGEEDAGFAGDVAQIVELALERRYAVAGPDAVPGIEEIQDLVEQALIELGRAQVAKAYILYRDRRTRIRSALVVDGEQARGARGRSDRAGHTDAAPSEERASPREHRAPRVQFSDGVASWSKGRIVAALMNESDLPRARAEEVAARVEERVFDGGYRRISTALIRELVDNELVELGLDLALKRQRVFGLSRHDLRRWLDEPVRRPSDGGLGLTDAETAGAERAVAGEILRRFVLEDAMPDLVAELHLSGEISIEDVARPHLSLWRALPCDLLLRGEPGPSSAFGALEDVADECEACAGGVVLEDCGALIQALARGRGASQGWLGQWLRAVSAVARASGRRIDLCAGGGSSSGASERAHVPAWISRALEELAALDAESSPAFAPRLFVDVGDLTAALRSSPRLTAAVERLLVAGRVVPTFGSNGETAVGPGLVRRARERGALTCGGAVAINLPRLARRAGPWREDLMLEQMSALVQHAMSALHALDDLQSGVRREHRGRVGYAITPVGLREALRWIGDGELRPDQGARVLGFLSEAAQRFGHASGLSVSVSPHFGERAAIRFAALDAELFSTSQPLLFDADDRPSVQREPYTCGFDVAGGDPIIDATFNAAAASLLAAQSSGILHPPSLIAALARVHSSAALERERSDDASAPSRARVGTAVLAALERLELARARLRGGGHALYALPRAEIDVPDVASSTDVGSFELFPEPASDRRAPLPTSLPHLSGTPHS